MKVAVVTGASQGIGAAVASRLAVDGYGLVLNSREPVEMAEKLRARGAHVIAVPGDLALESTAERIFDEVERLGRLDALFVNHGGPPVKPLLELAEEEWERHFRLIVLAPVRLLKLALPFFRRSGGGRVVAITSFVSKAPQSGMALSSALRAALVNAYKTAALELGKHNVLINLVAPGYIQTARLIQWMERRATQDALDLQELKQTVASTIPLGRFGTPEEIAELVAFLLSERNKYVTGQQILVDGGLVATV